MYYKKREIPCTDRENTTVGTIGTSNEGWRLAVKNLRDNLFLELSCVTILI
jgi:hypothetical protein